MNVVRMSCHVGLGLTSLALSCAVPEGESDTATAPSLVAQDRRGVGLTGVPSANAKAVGVTIPNALSPELMAVVAAQGANPVENPMVLPVGDPAVSVTHYGYDSDGPLMPAAGDMPSATHLVEA